MQIVALQIMDYTPAYQHIIRLRITLRVRVGGGPTSRVSSPRNSSHARASIPPCLRRASKINLCSDSRHVNVEVIVDGEGFRRTAGRDGRARDLRHGGDGGACIDSATGQYP